jgi:hypothetical protein
MALFNKLGLFKEPEAGNGWAPPAILDRGVIGQVCCVMDRDGRGQVLWENYGSLWLQTLGVHDEAAFARISLGPGAEPRVSANLDGAGVAAWVADVAGGRSVLGLPIAAWRTPGATRILFSTPGQVHHLQVAADRRGGALVVWCHEFDGLFEVMAKRFDVRARTWDEEPAKLGPRTTYPLEPRLAMNRSGNAVVVWKEQRRESDELVGCLFSSTARAWSEHPVPMINGRTNDCQVGLDPTGNLMLVTTRQDFGQRPLLEARVRSAASAAWLPSQVLASAQHFRQPRLVVTTTGEALAVWLQSEGSTLSFLYAKPFRSGHWEERNVRLDTETGKVEDFSLAQGPKGLAAVFSLTRHQSERIPMVRHWWRGWGAAQQLAKPVEEPLSQPVFSLGATGAIALWRVGEGASALLLAAQRHGPPPVHPQ